MTALRPPKWQGYRTAAGSSLATALSALPPFLVGSLAPAMRRDIDLNTGRLGVLVAIYFLAGALAAVPGGGIAERLGPRRALLITGSMTSLCLGTVGLVVESWAQVAAVIGIAGFANGMVHPAGNLAIMRGVAMTHRGVAFGIKQAAAPLATMFAGLALPLLAFTTGWRGTFLVATVFFPLVVMVLPPDLRTAEAVIRPFRRFVEPSLLLTALASALAFGGATTVGAFLVDSVVSAGGEPAVAGVTLTAASVACIAVRITIGWKTDRMEKPSAGLVAALMGIGGAGLFVLAWSPAGIWPLGAVVGMAAGWGWPGLLYHSVASANPEAPAAATAVATTGNALGAAIGPLLFGLIAGHASFELAWSLSGFSLVLAAALMLGQTAAWADRFRGRAP